MRGTDMLCVVVHCREIVKRIDMWGIDMVFVVGGNGGNAGAAAIQAQCEKDQVVCNIVGVPKSIDNDILVVSLHVVPGPIAQCLLQRDSGSGVTDNSKK